MNSWRGNIAENEQDALEADVDALKHLQTEISFDFGKFAKLIQRH